MKSVITDHLVKTYRNGEVRALNELSLDVEEGTVLSVLVVIKAIFIQLSVRKYNNVTKK